MSGSINEQTRTTPGATPSATDRPLPAISASAAKFTSRSILAVTVLAGAARADTTPLGVYTMRYNNARTATNTQETQLKPGNVNPKSFGKLFSYATDGPVWGQPLIAPNVTIPDKGVHNLLIVGTDFGTVYAFDADSNAGNNAGPLWSKSVSAPPDMASYWPGTTGVCGTPVIDPDSGTVYAVSQREENGTRVLKLHALDLSTGDEKFGGPVVISASVPGTGYGAQDGNVVLGTNAKHRSGLTLVNGSVYLVIGAYEENTADLTMYPPYHGWIIGYDAKTLQQTSAFCVTPNGSLGGIWLSGGAPAADADGNLYVMTGNGTFSADKGGTDYGDSFLKLSTTGGLSVVDWATPMNQDAMELYDADFGAGSPVLMDDPDTGKKLVFGLSKDGSLYVCDRNNLGHFSATDNAGFAQVIPAITPFGGFTTPTLWKNHIYIGGLNDKMRAFDYQAGAFASTATSVSDVRLGNPGAFSVISSNGDKDAILWVLDVGTHTAGGPLVLRAYDANDLTNELYDSDMNIARDGNVLALRFTAPIEANGKVYVPGAWQVGVYGLLPFLPGDANGDGVVDTADVIQTLSVAAGLSTATDIRAMDVAPVANGVAGDGVVDITDAVTILARIINPAQ